MEAVQSWFAPLLWIIGTISALAAFCRLCKPIWQFLQSPKEVNRQLQKLDEKVEDKFTETGKRMDRLNNDVQGIKNDIESLRDKNAINDLGTQALLRDRILQAHRYLMGKDAISQDEYESVTAMYDSYTALGGNHFVERLMQDLNKKPISTVPFESDYVAI